MAVFVKKDAQLIDVDELDFSLGVFDEQAVSFACPICGKRITAFRRKNELAKASADIRKNPDVTLSLTHF